MPQSPSTAMATAPQDRFLGGRLLLRQPARGYRAGLDAALLAAAVSLSDGQRALEAGCGVGAALLQAAVRSPGASFVGVERDLAAVEMASSNIAENALSGRVEVVSADVRTPFSKLGLGPFDAAFANPPYFDDEGALRAPDPERRDAWIADGGLQVWTGFLLKAGSSRSFTGPTDSRTSWPCSRQRPGPSASCPSILLKTPRPSACWCGRSRPGAPRWSSCRPSSCGTEAKRRTGRRWRRSFAAKRRWTGGTELERGTVRSSPHRPARPQGRVRAP